MRVNVSSEPLFVEMILGKPNLWKVSHQYELAFDSSEPLFVKLVLGIPNMWNDSHQYELPYDFPEPLLSN